MSGRGIEGHTKPGTKAGSVNGGSLIFRERSFPGFMGHLKSQQMLGKGIGNFCRGNADATDGAGKFSAGPGFGGGYFRRPGLIKTKSSGTGGGFGRLIDGTKNIRHGFPGAQGGGHAHESDFTVADFFVGRGQNAVHCFIWMTEDTMLGGISSP
jgi:hypothetical protein